MFDSIFEQRDKTVSNLVKLGDCLGRSLRENVALFSIDSVENKVNYLTESGKVITGRYTLTPDVVLEGIVVQESEVFTDNERFDSFVNAKVNSLIENLHYNELGDADDAFEGILSLWEKRVKLDTVQARLTEKAHKLGSVENILNTQEFHQVLELRPQVISFLQEGFEKISSVPEIKNAVNLSNSVSQAFDFRMLSYDDLVEGGSYTIRDTSKGSIYEMICRQELVKKEILESKAAFSATWANNDAIKTLASMIFENDENKVKALFAAIQEVPYLALASKKSLFECFSKCLSRVDGLGISDNDIREFSSDIFEIKKGAKESLINAINEKYGVNIQNLKDPASFKSLINTQVVIFESLSRLAPKGTLIKSVLGEMALSLRDKSGVQAIDLNDFIFEMFVEAGYGDCLVENTTLEDFSKADLKRVSEDVDYEGIFETLEEAEKKEEKKAEKPKKEEKKEEPKDSNYPSDETVSEEEEPTPEEVVDAEEEEEAQEPAAEDMPEEEDRDDVIKSMKDIEDVVDMIASELDGEEEDTE